MISGGILQAANIPESFNARTCSLSSGGYDKSPSTPERCSLLAVAFWSCPTSVAVYILRLLSDFTTSRVADAYIDYYENIL